MTDAPGGNLTETDAVDAGPKLWLVATPIGNLDDMGARAIRILKDADAVACEDTRVTRTLLDRFGVKPAQVFACHDHNEAASAAGIVKLISEGKTVALVSDAGTPGVSDPGYRVVRAVLDAGLEVSAVPGPSSVLAALTVSGLPSDRFVFAGFPPRKTGKRRHWFETFKTDSATIILMESPQRLAETLQDAMDVLEDRRAAVALELTKKFERVHRGRLSELAPRYADPPRGEAIVVIEGARRRREKVNKYAPDGGKAG